MEYIMEMEYIEKNRIYNRKIEYIYNGNGNGNGNGVYNC